ncbi:MAG: hypothetical protein J3K34DRAFT_419316 [Monoraphidium minutum]|nr:MAG: hypothetical protein J3K34DRAFT_419316 [Monoraphidium minutum]
MQLPFVHEKRFFDRPPAHGPISTPWVPAARPAAPPHAPRRAAQAAVCGGPLRSPAPAAPQQGRRWPRHPSAPAVAAASGRGRSAVPPAPRSCGRPLPPPPHTHPKTVGRVGNRVRELRRPRPRHAPRQPPTCTSDFRLCCALRSAPALHGVRPRALLPHDVRRARRAAQCGWEGRRAVS